MSTTETVLITAGNKGIGKATAIAFAKKGYNVAITSRDVANAADVVKEIETIGGKIHVIKADVGKEEDVINMVNETVKKYGRLDALVCNAGIEGDKLVPTAEVSTESFQNMLQINVMGVFWSMKYAIKEMLKTGGGSLVNVSSIFGVVGMPTLGPYVASKHAVNGLSKSTALEYASQGIRVNVVNPGPIKTDLFQHVLQSTQMKEEEFVASVQMKRAGIPEDVANGIVYLSAKENSFVTGTILLIDGGHTAQ